MRLILLLFSMFIFQYGAAQEVTFLKLKAAENPESAFSEMRPNINIGNQKVVAIMGGLNDWDGANNYFNLFGSKVIIERKDITLNGATHLVLRREDGENFYGLYPVLNAEIVPAPNKKRDFFNPKI
ncbi:hypothetical protein [Maribacter sp. 2210JD10-5]|uniref:hypothetical protein n=1 Tax=Maribacter sp. 2210JD10-5 TaxID=3386272 RepID=UPI0039BC2E8B